MIRYKGFEFDSVEEAVRFYKLVHGGFDRTDPEEAVRAVVEPVLEEAEEKVIKDKVTGRWTQSEVNTVVEFYKRNAVAGTLRYGKMPELVATLGKSRSAIESLVHDLKSKGKIQTNGVKSVDLNQKTVQIDKVGKPFTNKELKYIEDYYESHNNGTRMERGGAEKIALALKRKVYEIRKAMSEMRRQGLLGGPTPFGRKEGTKSKKRKPQMQNKAWTSTEDQMLISYVHKFVSKGKNVPTKVTKRVAKLLKRNNRAVHGRVYRLKQMGKL